MHLTSRYKLIRRLAHGAISRVYLVVDRHTAEQAVLKLIDLSAYQGDTKFSEAAILERLNHKAIPRLQHFYIDSTNKQACLLLPYIEGSNLELFSKQKGNCDFSAAHNYFCQLVEILCYIQKKRIVHRDINPANVMIDGEQKLWLIDFGSACVLGQKARHAATRAFAAPELINENKADFRSDIYSLGKLMIALIGEQNYNMFVKQMNYSVVNKKHLSSNDRLIEIIMRCVLDDPDRRYQTAAALSAALKCE